MILGLYLESVNQRNQSVLGSNILDRVNQKVGLRNLISLPSDSLSARSHKMGSTFSSGVLQVVPQSGHNLPKRKAPCKLPQSQQGLTGITSDLSYTVMSVLDTLS